MMRILRVVCPHAKLVIIDNDDCGIFDDNDDDDDNDWLVSRAANVKAAQVSCFAELPPVASGTSNCEQLRGHYDGDLMWMVVLYIIHIIL